MSVIYGICKVLVNNFTVLPTRTLLGSTVELGVGRCKTEKPENYLSQILMLECHRLNIQIKAVHF